MLIVRRLFRQLMAKSIKLLYRLFRWSVTPTAREVRISQWLYENYIDWGEPVPDRAVQKVASSRDIRP